MTTLLDASVVPGVLIRLSNVELDAIVDDEDEVLVVPYHWTFHTRTRYVVASVLHPEGGFRYDKNGVCRRKRYHLELHRLLMGLEFGDPRQVDHKNHNRLDNRRFNLEVVTQAQNQQNFPAMGGSRFRGVSWDSRRGKWVVRGRLQGRPRRIGYFDLEEEAGRAAAEWRAINMPFSEEGRARRTTER
jgi:hypothetical protein